MDPKTSRRNPRRRVRVPVLCWESHDINKIGQGKEIKTKDLSIDGLGFYSDKIYPSGTELSIDIYLPGYEKPILSKIRVVRVDAVINNEEYVIGAVFMDIQIEDKAKIESAINRMNIYFLLENVLKGGASDLHLTVGRPPMVRKEGRILTMAAERIDEGQVEAMLYPLITTDQIESFEKNKEFDFAFSPDLTSRFRVNLHWQKGFVEAALRSIPLGVKTFEELGLPVEQMEKFCKERSGLILIAGTTGSGKTTTMSAMVNYINSALEQVVITIEDPIENIFKSQNSIIKQRELGSDTKSYTEALRRVLRQDPDVICVGELLDGECLQAAMRAAETGHLVISTIHAPSTTQAIERVINFFPPEHAGAISQQLSSCLVGILYQVLIPGRMGGLMMGSELLINNNAMKNLIREAKYSLMGNVLQTGRSQGMYTLKNNLTELYSKGLIDDRTLSSYFKQENM